MTPKERNEVYKRALAYLPDNIWRGHRICAAICHGGGYDYAYIKDTCKKHLPELYLFYPKHNNMYWFDPSDVNTRLNILAFCIAMTE